MVAQEILVKEYNGHIISGEKNMMAIQSFQVYKSIRPDHFMFKILSDHTTTSSLLDMTTGQAFHVKSTDRQHIHFKTVQIDSTNISGETDRLTTQQFLVKRTE